MRPLTLSLALFGLAVGASLGGAFIADAGATFADGRTASLTVVPSRALGLVGPYDLKRIPLITATLHEVEVKYVDLARVDYVEMFRAALAATERLVPTTLFRQEKGSDLLHIQVGAHHGVIEIDPVVDRRTLEAAIKRVVALVADHVAVGDIPVEAHQDPWAAVEYAMVNGMLDTLDPHSRLLPPEDSREMDVENSGEFGGLGITIVEREGRITVEYPLPDTPASAAGIQSGDQILRIDGESTINMGLQEAVSRLRGPVGAAVRLTIGRASEAEPLNVDIVRARIKMNPVEGDLLDGGVGVVSIKSFHANVGADLDKVLSELSRRAQGGKLAGLILDMRGNPGGYLSQAVVVANKFLEDGLIVRTRGRTTESEPERARPTRTEPRYPIVVLIDASSASASEIVAGALRNNDRAITLGERSFGKGSVQNLDSFFDGSKLKLTVAQYYTPPGDQSIQGVGIPADIEVLPVVAEAGEDDRPPVALVHYRERARREADYERGLARQLEEVEEAVYALRMLRESQQRRRGPSLEYLREDPQVELARQVLVAARGKHRRSEVLASAGPVIERSRQQAETAIIDALAAVGIDWTPGPGVEHGPVRVKLDLGGEALKAGADHRVWLEVTNTGSSPLYRVVAVSDSESELLRGREFVLGRIDPGQTVRFANRVAVADGYPTEKTPVSFEFRDGDGNRFASWSTHVPVEGRPLPRLAWTWSVREDGDGDGKLHPGESLVLDLVVENVGDGPTAEAFARVQNLSGKSLDLLSGSLEIGTLRALDGSPCPLLALDDDASDDDSSVFDPRCVRTLEPRESWTGEIHLSLRDSQAWELDLTIGDARAYDHASVMRAGFHRTYTNTERIRITTESPGREPVRREPPSVTFSRAPMPLSDREQIVVSGRVTDDEGLAHIVVFHNGRKVFFADGGQSLRSLPFTADLSLEEGLNSVVVIATDTAGLTRSGSVVTSFTPDRSQALAEVGR